MPPIGDNGFNELSKMQYVKDFKFNLAYDNSDNRGWITEKMIHPMVVGTIPIYWGAVDVAEEFNKHAFLLGFILLKNKISLAYIFPIPETKF